MDGKNDHIVQWSMSIVKTKYICPEYPQNLPGTLLKSAWNLPKICPECPWNLPGMSWGRPANPQVPDEVPSSLGTFPRVPQVPEMLEWQVWSFLWGGNGPLCNIGYNMAVTTNLNLHLSHKTFHFWFIIIYWITYPESLLSLQFFCVSVCTLFIVFLQHYTL
jgi:hypothetical protein